MRMRRLSCWSIGLCIWMGAFQAYAAGFGVFTHGAHALGQSNAVTAHNHMPSTVFFNPALINDLSGTQLEVGTTMIAIRQKFISAATGVHTDAADNEFFPSTFYLTKTLSEKLSMGIGVFNPFGLATEWPDDWEGRYLTTKSEMTTLNVNPVISWRVTPDVSVAAGVAFLWLDATLQNKLNMTLLGFPAGFADGHQTFDGDGQGAGHNFGLSVRLNDRTALGASYRSAIDVTAHGRLSNRLPAGAGGVTALFPATNAETQVSLPRQISAGIAYNISAKAILEVGLRWEEWSAFDELRITFDRPVAGQTHKITPRNWDDTLAVNIGAKYHITHKYSLLLGFMYQNDPIPDETFDPAIPGSDSYLYSIGMAAKFNRFEYSVGYGMQWRDDRTKRNTISAVDGSTANGEYKAILHLLGLSCAYRF